MYFFYILLYSFFYFFFFFFFFFNDTATTEIYTLSLHDALPLCFRHSFYWHQLVVVTPSNGSRLSCGRLARRRKGGGRSPGPARARHQIWYQVCSRCRELGERPFNSS